MRCVRAGAGVISTASCERSKTLFNTVYKMLNCKSIYSKRYLQRGISSLMDGEPKSSFETSQKQLETRSLPIVWTIDGTAYLYLFRGNL